MTILRREFLATIPVAIATAATFAQNGKPNDAMRAFLQPHVLTRRSLDLFLDPWLPHLGSIRGDRAATAGQLS